MAAGYRQTRRRPPSTDFIVDSTCRFRWRCAIRRVKKYAWWIQQADQIHEHEIVLEVSMNELCARDGHRNDSRKCNQPASNRLAPALA